MCLDIIEELFGPETEMDRLASSNRRANEGWVRALVDLRARVQRVGQPAEDT